MYSANRKSTDLQLISQSSTAKTRKDDNNSLVSEHITKLYPVDTISLLKWNKGRIKLIILSSYL